MKRPLFIFISFIVCFSFSFAQLKNRAEIDSINKIFGQKNYHLVIDNCQSMLVKADSLTNFESSLLHSNIGLAYENLGNNTEAEKYLYLSILDLRDSTEETKYQQAVYKFWLASLYKKLDRFDEADYYYRQSLGLLSVAFGQNSKQYCSMYAECAKMYVEMGRYTEALPMINGTVYFNRILYGEKDKEFLESLNDLARVYQGIGNYPLASLYFDSIISAYAKYYKDTDRENFAIMINNAGENYRLMADFDMAEKYLLDAYHLSDSFPQNQATVLNNLGLVYTSRGLYNDAERSFNESINIYNKTGEGNTLVASIPYNGLGNIYRVTGRFKQAIQAFQKVINIRERVGGTNHQNFANVLVNIALTYADQGLDAEAEAMMQKAYVIYYNLLGDNHVLTANCLNNLGAMRLKAGDVKEAERYKLAAIEIYKKLVGEKSDRYAAFLSGLMMVYERKKDYVKAMECLNKVDKILTENFGGNNYDYYHNLFNKAVIYRKMKNPNKAQEFFIAGIEGYKKLLKDFFPYMNEEEKTAVNFSMAVRFEQFANFVFEAKEKKWPVDLNKLNVALCNFQLSNKSSLLNESADFQRKVYASNDSSVIGRYEYLVEMRKYIGNKYRRSKEELSADGIYIDSLEMEAGKLEKNLNAELSTNSSPTDITWQNVAAKLDKNAAAIEIIRTEDKFNDSASVIKYGALIIKNGIAAPQLVLLRNGNKLDKEWLDDYRWNIEEKRADKFSYDRYWKPLSEMLTGVQNVYFSGDGVYLQLSLNTLLNAVTQKYVLDEKDIHLVTNTKDILNSNAPSKEKKDGVFFGYPDYEFDFVLQKKMQEEKINAALATRFGFSELPALPGTKKEVNDIVAVFKSLGYNPEAYLAEFASEKQVKAVKSPLVLHIATHGFFLPDFETEDEKILGFSTEKAKQNPLLRSGLMLAGASVVARDTAVLHDKDEDGILTAYEASLLNLQGTELVVLSACQTGLGETTNGQGVYGLQRAFLIAGARSLIMSMWVVDDYATQELMTEFYTQWLKDPVASNKLPSFKKAQQKIKLKYKDPFYWGAFVLLER